MTKMKWTNSARQPSTTGDRDMKIITTVESYRITYKYPIPGPSIYNGRVSRYVGGSFLHCTPCQGSGSPYCCPRLR